MFHIFTMSLVLIIVLGCSTTGSNSSSSPAQFRPPEIAYWPINADLSNERDFDSVDLYLNRLAKEHPNETSAWWVDYRRAQLWSKKNKNIACENFSRLAQEQEFPIRRVAYLHAHEVCPKENQILARLENFDLNNIDPWLSRRALDVAIIKAEQKNDRESLIELYLKKSKILLNKTQKLEFAEKALHLARKLNLATRIRELENRIYSLSPSQRPNPNRKELLAVANDLRYLRQFSQALDIYQRIIKDRKSNPNEKLQAYRGIRAVYKIQQNRDLARKATENLAQYTLRLYKKSRKLTSDADLVSDSHLLLARTYWTDQMNDKAIATLDLITKTVRGTSSLAEVFWMRGRMSEEQQDFVGAIEWFKKALDERINSVPFRNKITWYLAWNYRKSNQLDLAEENFKKLVESTEGGFEKGRYQFWLAKTYGQNKKSGDAEDEFKKIKSEDPLGFYGLLAHRELGETIPAKLITKSESVENKGQFHLSKQLHQIVDENYLAWLIATQEVEIAGQYLDEVATQLKKTAPDHVESWAQLLQIYALSQNFLAMFNQINTLRSEVRREILETDPKLIFPNPYFETVAQSAGRFGISPEFVYSIMRQESSFNPLARSHMDAFGLMQLLPEVAKRSAIANSIDYRQAEDLYSPHINIPLGSAHLRELWDKYKGEIILATASYNASETAILNWLKTRFRGDTLEFIEDIPYDETRDYVKLVLRNFVNYQILSAQEDRLSFPEWTLKLSQQEVPTE